MLEVGESEMTAELARMNLEEWISLRGPIINNLQDLSNNEMLEVPPNVQELPEENTALNSSVAHARIKRLIRLVTPENPESIPGETENALYFPPIVDQLERVAKEFPLWSSAVLPDSYGPDHASTAAQEGYFNQLKNRIFGHITLPCNLHKFFKEHLNDIAGDQDELGAELKDFVHRSKEKSSLPPKLDEFQDFPETGSQQNDKVTARFPPEPDEFGAFPETGTQKNDNVTTDLKNPWEDSEFDAKMLWRGKMNDYCKSDYHHNATLIGSSQTFSADINMNTGEICSEILNIEEDYSFGLAKENSSATDNNNNQFDDDANEELINNNRVGNNSSSLLDTDPGFLSTLNKECQYVPKSNSTPLTSEYYDNDPKGCRKASRGKKKGSYFVPCPQIKISNKNGVCGRRVHFYQMARFVQSSNGIAIKLVRTCGFDSLAHVLEYAALDDPKYALLLENSSNDFLKFVADFLKHGVTTTIFLRRCALLCNHYAVRRPRNSTSLDPYTLDCEDTLTKIWKQFYGEPVAHRRSECNNIYCPVGTSGPLYDLALNHRIISDKGFREGLPQAIDAFLTWQCKKVGCGGTVNETLVCAPCSLS
ncbi:uncharacterized protein [Fopius arisanus]|uniref:Uncharacterized protein n=1 Tax=Fopius arisanus TaxID=64838 RepID=A0A9R1TPR5_9HYME|nr:PREDICTED: uncharacterized protein LOC105272630 [Fopius arisanus]